eukprot:472465-Rhodomonas_salina.2
MEKGSITAVATAQNSRQVKLGPAKLNCSRPHQFSLSGTVLIGERLRLEGRVVAPLLVDAGGRVHAHGHTVGSNPAGGDLSGLIDSKSKHLVGVQLELGEAADGLEHFLCPFPRTQRQHSHTTDHHVNRPPRQQQKLITHSAPTTNTLVHPQDSNSRRAASIMIT